MSYYEALEDNIPMEKKNGFTYYYPSCRVCGSPTPSWNYLRGMKYTCKDCKELLVEQERAEKASEELDVKVKKFRTAVKRIEKVADITKYQKAIKLVQNNLSKPGWFQSAEEVMAAIELLKRGYKVQHQVKIFDYRVDFIIPELKAVLEIDEPLFHRDKQEKEQIRDSVIESKLGKGWNVVRVKTDMINKNVTRLVPGIKAVIRYRERKNSL